MLPRFDDMSPVAGVAVSGALAMLWLVTPGCNGGLMADTKRGWVIFRILKHFHKPLCFLIRILLVADSKSPLNNGNV